MINVLYIGNTAHQLSANLAKTLNQCPDINIDAIFSLDKHKDNQIFESKYHKVYWYKIIYNKLNIPRFNGLFSTIRLMFCLFKLHKYDVIHIQYVSPDLFLLLPVIKHKSDHLVATVWGSDLDASKNIRLFSKILNATDSITCTNTHFKERITFIIKDGVKEVVIMPFTLPVLDEISHFSSFSKEQIKAKMDIPTDHLVICCGTNGRKMQHHIQIIEEIAKIKDCIIKPIFFLLPMSYGEMSNEYLKQIETKLELYNFPHKILKSFMSEQEVAMVRIVSDVLIQVQDHDQFSGAMLETIYANNLVITGSWLPYSLLDETGIYYFKVDHLTDIHKMILNCVNNYDKLITNTLYNRLIIDRIVSNSTVSQMLLDFYKRICN